MNDGDSCPPLTACLFLKRESGFFRFLYEKPFFSAEKGSVICL